MSKSNAIGPLAILGAGLGLAMASSLGGDSSPGSGPPKPGSGNNLPPPSKFTPTPVGSAIAESAIAANGWRYGNPETKRLYLLRVYPGDITDAGEPDANAEQMGAVQSSCELFARGNLANAGVHGMITYKGKQVDILRAPYAKYVGQIDEMLQAFAKAKGILISQAYKEKPTLAPGDIVVVGSGGGAPSDEAERQAWLKTWGGVAHALVVVGFNDDIVSSVDGGQPDSGTGKDTAIELRHRQLRQVAGAWYIENRRINYIIKSSSLDR